MVSTMSITNLTVPGPILREEHRLEDLARRLAGELGIELKPHSRYHGISAPTWLSGENEHYEIHYCDDFDDTEEYINIEKTGEGIRKRGENLKIDVTCLRSSYYFSVSVPDTLLLPFIERVRGIQLTPQMSQLHIRLKEAIVNKIEKLKIESRAEGIAMNVYSFMVPLEQDYIGHISGEIIRSLLP